MRVSASLYVQEGVCMAFEFERKITPKLILSIIATGLTSFCGIIVETSMNVTFPTLMSEFGIGTSTVQWITTGYLLVLAVILPTSSFLNKRFKLRTLFIAAASLFILGTLLCAWSPVFAVLLIGRLIQGAGTGIAMPLMFNIVLQQVPYDKTGMMIGVASILTTIGPAIGPTVGGLVVTYMGWRMIFVILLPILIFALLAGIFCIRQSSELSKPSFDVPGYIIIIICFVSLVIGSSMAGDLGWASPVVIGLIVLCVIMAAIYFIYAKKKDEKAILNVSVFKYKGFNLCLIAYAVFMFICLAMSFIIPNYTQLVNGHTALQAGLAMMPGCLVMSLIGPFSGKLYDKIGGKVPFMVGGCFIIIAQILFNIFIRQATILTFILIYLVFALGVGLSSSNSMTHGLKQIPENLQADGNAIYNTLQQLFAAIGTSITSSIVALAQAKTGETYYGTINGSANAYIMLLILAVANMVIMLFVVADIRKKEKAAR